MPCTIKIFLPALLALLIPNTTANHTIITYTKFGTHTNFGTRTHKSDLHLLSFGCFFEIPYKKWANDNKII